VVSKKLGQLRLYPLQNSNGADAVHFITACSSCVAHQTLLLRSINSSQQQNTYPTHPNADLHSPARDAGKLTAAASSRSRLMKPTSAGLLAEL